MAVLSRQRGLNQSHKDRGLHCTPRIRLRAFFCEDLALATTGRQALCQVWRCLPNESMLKNRAGEGCTTTWGDGNSASLIARPVALRLELGNET